MPSEKIRYLKNHKEPVATDDEVLSYLTSRPNNQLAQRLIYRSENDVVLRKLIYTEASLIERPINFATWKQIADFALDLQLAPIDTELEEAGADQILELLIHKLEVFKADMGSKECRLWADYLYDCAETLTDHFHNGFLWNAALENLDKLRC